MSISTKNSDILMIEEKKQLYEEANQWLLKANITSKNK